MFADDITDRIRSVCAGAPFYLKEVETWTDFERVPSQAIDGCFRIPPMSSQSTLGGFGFTEDRVDTLQIWVARKHRSDYPTVRRTLLRDMHSLTAACIRDATVSSEEFGILDEGRGHAISPAETNAEFVTLRLTLPVNYEVQL